MARILIPTYPADVHAVEVALVLTERGHEAILWYGSDFPTRQSAALEFGEADESGNGFSWSIEGAELPAAGPPFDTVWVRRPTPAVLPADLHPGDRPMAERENREFISALYFLAAPEAFWVNPLGTRYTAGNKGLQLREAARAGLTIPPTLMTNDPGRIRRFLARYAGRAVYKPFYPAEWQGAESSAVLWTSEVTEDDLPDDSVLRATPGIFQARIEKAHELRVTMMGGHTVTARLHSQETGAGRTDWRAAGTGLRVEPGELPEPVEAACRRLLTRLGIVFGCFDFIVTPAGEHVFLEVNPAGQFLWVEEAAPELPLLAPFVDFLLAGRADFHWQPGNPLARHAAYHPEAVARIDAGLALHVAPEQAFVSVDLEDDEEEEEPGS